MEDALIFYIFLTFHTFTSSHNLPRSHSNYSPLIHLQLKTLLIVAMSMDQVVRDKNDPIEEEEDEVIPLKFLSLSLDLDVDSAYLNYKQTNDAPSLSLYLSSLLFHYFDQRNSGALLHW